MDGGAVAAVPAEGTLPERLLERLDRPPHVPALGLAPEPPHLLPAPAVAARLVTGLPKPGRNLGVALQRGRGGEEGDREPKAVHQALDPPHSRPRSVFVDGLRPRGRDRQVPSRRESLSGRRSARSPAGWVYSDPLLVVEDEVDGDAGTVRPSHLRHVAAVTDVVTPRTRNVLVDEWSGRHDSTSSCVNRAGDTNRASGRSSSPEIRSQRRNHPGPFATSSPPVLSRLCPPGSARDRQSAQRKRGHGPAWYARTTHRVVPCRTGTVSPARRREAGRE